jgi:glycerate kinase
MTDRGGRQAAPVEPHGKRGWTSMSIPTKALIVTGAFGPALSASRVAAALARGLSCEGRPEPEVCLLPEALESHPAMRLLLQELVPEARLRSARAVILGEKELDEPTLARTAIFELATRARQSGVPAYAVTGENRLSAFDARMLDLQLIVAARTPRALSAAGRRLASVL